VDLYLHSPKCFKVVYKDEAPSAPFLTHVYSLHSHYFCIPVLPLIVVQIAPPHGDTDTCYAIQPVFHCSVKTVSCARSYCNTLHVPAERGRRTGFESMLRDRFYLHDNAHNDPPKCSRNRTVYIVALTPSALRVARSYEKPCSTAKCANWISCRFQ
jgi:hypothetical protein